jgi:hypothetical protein
VTVRTAATTAKVRRAMAEEHPGKEWTHGPVAEEASDHTWLCFVFVFLRLLISFHSDFCLNR